MAFGLDSTGFTIKRLPDILDALRAKAAEVFGTQITTDPDSVFGQLFAVFANELTTAWEGLQGTYDAYRPDAAEGVNLDEVADLNAIVRLPATQSEVTALLIGDPSTVIPAGSLASVIPTNAQFELQEEVELDPALVARIEATSASSDGLYSLTINGTAFSYTATSDTAAEIVAALKLAVDAGTEPVTFIDNEDGTFVLESDDLTTEYTLAATVNITINTVARISEWKAVEDGPIDAPVDTLTRIDTPVFGWDEITNPEEGLAGTDIESDTALRLRRRASVSKPGAGTADSIASNLRQIEGVTHAFIVENRTFAVDDEGRPPKSFEAIVIGGDEQEIGDTIWERKPVGIETVGDIAVDVVDAQGLDRSVSFSRPTDVWVHLDIQYTLYDEETFPLNGEGSIVGAVVDFGTEEFDIGKDVILQRFFGAIFSTAPGIATIAITIATGPTAEDPPNTAFTANNLAVAASAIARFDAARITISDVTP